MKLGRRRVEGWARLERGKGERKGGKKDGGGGREQERKNTVRHRESGGGAQGETECLLLSASPTSFHVPTQSRPRNLGQQGHFKLWRGDLSALVSPDRQAASDPRYQADGQQTSPLNLCGAPAAQKLLVSFFLGGGVVLV